MCFVEAEYMYRLRKDIIPLVLQSGYCPDGWLGILVGTRLYFDLSCPATFEHELSKLISEIGDRGRQTPLLSRCTSSASMSTPPPRSVVDSPVPHGKRFLSTSLVIGPLLRPSRYQKNVNLFIKKIPYTLRTSSFIASKVVSVKK